MNKLGIIWQRLKSIKRDKQGLISTVALVLMAIMTVILLDMMKLAQEDDHHRQFLKEKSITYNALLSVANETRWEMYHYYSTGEGSEEIVKAAQGKYFTSKEVKKYALGKVWRKFDVDGEGNGAWTFKAVDSSIMPSIKWVYKVKDGKIVASRWAP